MRHSSTNVIMCENMCHPSFFAGKTRLGCPIEQTKSICPMEKVISALRFQPLPNCALARLASAFLSSSFQKHHLLGTMFEFHFGRVIGQTFPVFTARPQLSPHRSPQLRRRRRPRCLQLKAALPRPRARPRRPKRRPGKTRAEDPRPHWVLHGFVRLFCLESPNFKVSRAMSSVFLAFQECDVFPAQPIPLCIFWALLRPLV